MHYQLVTHQLVKIWLDIHFKRKGRHENGGQEDRVPANQSTVRQQSALSPCTVLMLQLVDATRNLAY